MNMLRKIAAAILFIIIVPFALLAAAVTVLTVWISGEKEPWERTERP